MGKKTGFGIVMKTLCAMRYSREKGGECEIRTPLPDPLSKSVDETLVCDHSNESY